MVGSSYQVKMENVMQNVIVFNNENKFGRLVEIHEAAIAECVNAAIKATAVQMGPVKFVSAILERERRLAKAA